MFFASRRIARSLGLPVWVFLALTPAACTTEMNGPESDPPDPPVNDNLIANLVPEYYETASVGNGERYYVDRDFTVTGFDGEDDAWVWIRTSNEDWDIASDSFISFELSEPAAVAVAYDDEAEEYPNWLDGWSRSPFGLHVSQETSSPMQIFYKEYDSGTVVLGGNLAEGASGARSMYVVLVLATTELGPIVLEVTPANVTLNPGDSNDFTTTLRNQLGEPIEGEIVWSASGGSISDAGLYTAGQEPGTYEVEAEEATSGLTATARITIESEEPPPPPPPGGSETFYVDGEDPGASDSNPGTEEQPWKTLYRAADVLTAGQTVYVKAGTYNLDQDCSWSSPAVNPENSGRADAPIAFRAYPGHRVVLTGSDCPVIGTSGRDYIIVDGFEIDGTRIGIFNSVGSIVENNVVHGRRCDGGDNCDGIRVNDSDGVIIRHNVIYDIWNAERSPNSSGYKSYNTSNSIIEYNEVYDTNSGLRNKRRGRNNVFRYNYVHDVTGKAIWLQAGQEHKAHHNVTYRCGDGVGISGAGEDRAVDNEAWNNTMVECDEGIGDGDSGTRIWNNIFYNVDRPTEGSYEYCDHNLYFGPTGCGSTVEGDPLFQETDFDEESDVELRSGSPAIGAGRDGGNIGAK